jgi:hypothetical protein
VRAAARPDGIQQMSKIIVNVGQQMDGMTFRLSPKTRAALSSHLPSQSLPSSIFVSYETTSDLEHAHEPIWKHIVMMLTGLNEGQITKLGGFKFVTPTDDKVLFELKALH